MRGRNSDNRLIEARLGWKPATRLAEGLQTTYRWIERQLFANHPDMSRSRLALGWELQHGAGGKDAKAVIHHVAG